ncbi:hypothetical protein [Oceanobacillus kimchii]|uniref:hypothetical protein n=1 Tax=Oceanobacillus kimchii TaxID=746691 RepID=UPI003C795D3E
MLQHQITMNDCILAFKKLSESRSVPFEFISERELRSNYLTQNFSKEQRRNTTMLKKVPDRIPDFVLIEGSKKIACEVELTVKSKKRYEEKFERYKDEILNNEYSIIRYLCSDEKIIQTVDVFAADAGLDRSMFQRELIRRLVDSGSKKQ